MIRALIIAVLACALLRICAHIARGIDRFADLLEIRRHGIRG